jgi:hypothetical protein
LGGGVRDRAASEGAHPSRRAVEYLLRAFRFQPVETPWRPYLDRWGTKGPEDYDRDERTSYLTLRQA